MTRRLQLAITRTRSGVLIADITNIAQNVQIEDGPHGPGVGSCFVPGSLAESFRLYNRGELPWLRLSDGARCIWAGRIEQVAIVPGGVQVHALGAARGLADAPYTTLWSTTSLEAYTPQWLIDNTSGPTTNRFFTVDAENSVITIGLVKNTIMALNTRAQMDYRIPNSSSRNIVGCQLDTEFLASANVTLRISAWSSAYPFGGFTANLGSLVGNGAVQKVNVFLTFTGTPVISFGLQVTTAHTYAGETGAEYVKFLGIRLVSDTSNQINTTLTAARTNGSPVTCTVGSTANMYVGQTLLLQSGANNDVVTVLTIPSSTTFTANVTRAPGGGFPIGTSVLAWLIYANQIVSDIVTTADDLLVAATGFTTTTLNRTIDNATARIESPGVDLLEETYEDADRLATLDYLTGLGDTNTPARTWRWYLDEFQRMVFAPLGAVAAAGAVVRTWAIDIEDLTVERDLDGLTNNVYAVYQDADGRTVRSAAAQDIDSISQYGIVRQQATAVNTTLAAQAQKTRDTLLADRKTLRPRASFAIRQLYATNGARVALWEIKAGDTLLIRNLPPGVSSDLDKVRRFRITRATLDIDAGKITVEPESPLPALEAMLARIPHGAG